MRDALGEVQSVLVLGGTSDIAQAIVARLGQRRPLQVVTAGRHDCDHHFDAADRSGHEALVDRLWAEHGDFDVVLFAWGMLGDTPEVIDVNCTGAVSIGQPVAARMRAQGHGSIVALSSVAAIRARRSNYVYGASKAGYDAFFTGLGHELAGTGVHVMVVRPGFVRTKMTEGLQPMPLATTPDAVADAVADGLRRRREYVYVPRALQPMMGVVRLLPTPVFRRLPS